MRSDNAVTPTPSWWSLLAHAARAASAIIGFAALLVAAWLMSGYSLGLDRLVVTSDPPRPARAIVCVTGGLAGHGLPTAEGWDRIYTAVQLLVDGFAPVVVFSGGGAGQLSEAEAYAEAARWLGCPASAIVLDPFPGSTAEHPRNLLRLDAPRIEPGTPLLVVTSRLHSRRVSMCFRKSGYSNFRVVTSYEAERSPLARSRLKSALPRFVPNGKNYGDPLNQLRWGFDETVVTLRELAAIGVYWMRGQV